MTNQPEWKLIAMLGDVDPISYGGSFIYHDLTGVYPDECEYIDAPDSDDGEWRIYRFILDRHKIVTITDLATNTDHDLLVVPFNCDASWPHAIATYDEWFNRDLDKVASYVGQPIEELREAFTSSDSRIRAQAFLDIGAYHGMANLDSYPIVINSRDEIDLRYADDLREMNKR